VLARTLKLYFDYAFSNGALANRMTQPSVSSHTESSAAEQTQRLRPALVFAVMFLVLLVRVLHLSSAVASPFTYQVGPDEDYYQRFGQAVAAGHGQDSPEFTFMDPAYGYLLGGIFKLFGFSLFVVYVLQVLLDTATAYGIFTAGRLLGRPRAGLYGAILYGVTSLAIEFSASALKEIWVSAFMTWWVVAALLLVRGDRRWNWLPFGVFCGLGVGLRSTLLLMGIAGVLLPLLRTRASDEPRRGWVISAMLVACGLAVALLPWSIRNDRAYGSFSPLAHNGGVVLAQIYNADNPTGDMWIPGFVHFSHPSEIWRGYAAEAARRLARTLSPQEVDRYWQEQALSFMRQHPGQVLRDVTHKLRSWLASTEIPSTRSDVEERMFSPIVRYLPPPGIWLFACGFAGLAWLATCDRRWVVVATPILVAFLASIIFFSESRFRFHAASMLALCTGVLADQFIINRHHLLQWRVSMFAALAAVVAATAFILGLTIPTPAIRWDSIAWGYIKMGHLSEATAVLDHALARQPDNGALIEAQAYLAAAQKHYVEAAHELQHAIELRPGSHLAHYNLARAYMMMGDHERALSEAKRAAELNPSADYDALVRQLSAQ
jgi:4-amino-4-deoxy-L-arabinose transferase-like glycosyltransferase